MQTGRRPHDGGLMKIPDTSHLRRSSWNQWLRCLIPLFCIYLSVDVATQISASSLTGRHQKILRKMIPRKHWLGNWERLLSMMQDALTVSQEAREASHRRCRDQIWDCSNYEGHSSPGGRILQPQHTVFTSTLLLLMACSCHDVSCTHVSKNVHTV